ncbi:retrovirus-related pol polyprotein from transposon TNT 1-94 [Tanacetum coccineum]
MDENEVVIKNRARLEAIRIFLEYDAYMSFMVCQMDLKSAFLNGKISEEVYVQQPPGFKSSEFPNYIYVDDIIFGSTSDKLGFQIKQDFKRISICHEKYVKDLLKKYDLADSALVKCPMLPPNNLGPNESGVSVNETQFRGMIGSLMYLTASRPDIQFSTCLCARYQANPKESHLVAVKRIFSAKKQSSMAMSSAEAEYVDDAGCCAQVLWIKSQLDDYDVLYDKNYAPLPQKETVRATLATLGLANENDPRIPSTDLVNSSPLRIRYFSATWRVLMLYIGLDIDIGYILFFDLVVKLTTGKKVRDPNICYTRYLSLIIEHLLGDAYKNENLKTMKPYQITASSLKVSIASEVPLNSHMLKVAKISQQPEKTLILPSWGVNADSTADKPLSGTDVQHGAQHKAPIDKKSQKKKIPSFVKPKTFNVVRKSLSKKQVAETQHAEELVATTYTTKSIVASESTEVPGNRPKPADDEKEVKEEFGIKSLKNVSFDELYGNDLNMRADESPFDTESEIKFVGKVDPNLNIDYQGAGSLLVDKDITEANSDLESMLDDKIESVYGFKVDDDDDDEDDHSEHKAELLKTNEAVVDDVIDELVAMRVADKIDDLVPRMVADALEERLLELISDTLKNILPDLLKDSIKKSLPKFDKKVKKTLRVEVPDIILKPFKTIHSTVGKYVKRNVKKEIRAVNELLRWNAKHQLQLIKYLEQMVHSQVRVPRDIMVINAKQLQTKIKKNVSDILKFVDLIRGLVWLDPIVMVPTPTQRDQQPNESTAKPVITKEVSINAQGEQMSSALVMHSANEPPVKKLKVILDDIHIPSPTSLNSIRPTIINNILYERFVENLFSSGHFEFSPTPPSKIADKGKGKAQVSDDDELKKLLHFMDKGGYVPKLPNLQQFSTSREAEKEKSKKRIQKVLSPDDLQAQAEELAVYEAKRAKMLEEYNHGISFRAYPLPTTKINYRINNSTKEASMRIIRNNQPLNLIVYERFVLKMLGFNEWLELHDLVSRVKSKANDQLLKNLKAKFQWVATQARKLGISLPSQLLAFGLSTSDKKRKRSFEIIKEVFVKEDIVVDGMHRNLVPTSGVVASEGLVIKEPKSGIFFYNSNFDLVFQREEEFHLATTPRLIRIQNAIRRNSSEAKEIYNKLNFVIEARNDVIEAKKIVLDKLDKLGTSKEVFAYHNGVFIPTRQALIPERRSCYAPSLLDCRVAV